MPIAPRENLIHVYNHEEPEYMPLMSDFDMSYPNGLDYVNERPEIPGTNKDWFGQSWTYVDDLKAASPTPNSAILDDISNWKDIIHFPDLEKLDWESHAKQDTANWDRENRLSRVTVFFGLWERLNSVMNFDDALCALIEDPEACYEFFGAVADHKIRLHRKIIQYYKPDVLIMHDDYGTNEKMFMSPTTWRELIKPHLKRVVEDVTAQGVIYEHHSCGYFAPIIPDLIEIGVAATNMLQICNNPKEIKEKYGDKFTIVGGFDNILFDKLNCSEEEARESVRKTMDDLAPGGSFIPLAFSIGSNSMAVNEEVVSYANNFYGPRQL